MLERVARIIGSRSPYDVAKPAVLTKEKHRAAARRRAGGEVGGRSVGPGAKGLAPRTKVRRKPPVEFKLALPLPECRGCGAILSPEPERKRSRGAYCPGCIGARRREIGDALPATARSHAQSFAARTGVSPTHNAEVRERRRRANADRRAEQEAWDQGNLGEEPEPQWFQSRVLPKLAALTLIEIAQATGLSTSAASKIRAGRWLPHRRHWMKVAALIGVEWPST
jgi:hypothetical protein